MRGSIIKRGRRYYAVVAMKDPKTGKSVRRWHAAGTTKAEAERVLAAKVSEIHGGAYVAGTRATLGTYLLETWLPAAAPTVRPSTAALYRTIIDSYVVPTIGGLPLQAVKGSDLNALYAQLGEQGGKSGRPLAAKSVRNVHTLLHRAFRDAIRWELVNRNPADAADPPKVTRRAPAHWSADEVSAFLDATRFDRLGPLWHLIAATGMRRGEALALTWSDLDLRRGTVSISKNVAWVNGAPVVGEPKTAAGRRAVPLPAATVAVLKAHQKRQATERETAGDVWEARFLVFCREDGGFLRPGSITKAFEAAVKRAGLSRLTVHGLRHTWATLALEGGVLTKVAADVLGHSSATITADLYQHTTEPATRDASERVAAAIFGASG